jgi:2-amino-4-hydroxy-6-hydroxymethyldihydropteridine diphosphokinase
VFPNSSRWSKGGPREPSDRGASGGARFCRTCCRGITPRLQFRVTRAYVALGSNLGDRSAHLAFACNALGRVPRTVLAAVSSSHETDAVGPPPQGRYLNAAAALDTSLTAREFLNALLEIEQTRGRTRTGQRWGPRTLDLDLLLFGDQILSEPGLTVPHPRLHERLFVLAPLAEIAPDAVVPTLHRSVADLLKSLAGAGAAG